MNSILKSIRILFLLLAPEEKWDSVNKEKFIILLIKEERREETFFYIFSKILSCFVGQERIKNRWCDAWEDLMIRLYYSDQDTLENMLNCLEIPKHRVKHKLCLEDVFSAFVETVFWKSVSGLQELSDICILEKYQNIKNKSIRFTNRFLEMNSYSEDFQKNIQDLVTQYIELESDNQKRIIIIHLAASGKIVSQDIFRKYCSCVYLEKDLQVKYYFGVYELATLLFNYPKLVFDDYYLERKEFLQRLADELKTKLRIDLNAKERNGKRIAVLVGGLHGKRLASTRLEIYTANELQNQGYEVKLFVTDLNRRKGHFKKFVNPMGTRDTSSKMFSGDHEQMKNKGLGLFYNDCDPKTEPFFLGMLENVLREIYEYSPEFIVDIQAEYTLLNYLLFDDFRIVTVPLAGISSEAKYDRIVTRDMLATIEKNKLYYSVDEKKMDEGNIYIPYDISPVRNASYKRKKVEKTIAHSEFVIVTVGNRLNTEIDYNLVLKMVNLLSKNKNFIWVLVGAFKGIYEELKPLYLDKRVITLGAVKDLPFVYSMCDVFLNPIRQGGGGSVAMFVQMGKPAIVNNITSDIRPFIGIENCISGSYDDMLLAVERVYKDPVFAKNLADNQRSKLMGEEFSPASFAKTIIESGKKITRTCDIRA